MKKVVYGTLSACLLLAGCGPRSAQSAQDMVALRTHLNAGVGKIVNMDSILCHQANGANGLVYFDDLVWTHLSVATRKSTAECLDLRKKLRVRAIAASQEPVRVWTARIDEDALKLSVGWLYSDCPACDPETKTAEYRLIKQADFYRAEIIPAEEQWQ